MFILEAVSLGHLKRVIMGHDGTGPGQGWFLDSVDIREMPRGMTWHFACDRYLAITVTTNLVMMKQGVIMMQ